MRPPVSYHGCPFVECSRYQKYVFCIVELNLVLSSDVGGKYRDSDCVHLSFRLSEIVSPQLLLDRLQITCI